MRGRIAILVLACSAAAAAPAAAAFPGENGPLVVALNEPSCGGMSHYLLRVPWRGGAGTAITPKCDVTDDDFGPRDVFAADASPDGRTLIARQRRVAHEVGFITLTPNGGRRRLIHATVTGQRPSFAPDGLRFAFDDLSPDFAYDDEGALWEGHLDGSAPRRIRDNLGCRQAQQCGWTRPRWSPDGRLLAVAFSAPYWPAERSPIRPGIWLMRPGDGSLVRRLHGVTGGVDWAPDGRRLVYVRRGGLSVVSRDGRRRRALVEQPGRIASDPVWSPDGRWIAWLSLQRHYDEIRPSLWRVPARGGAPRKIRDLEVPYEEEGQTSFPDLTWLPLPR